MKVKFYQGVMLSGENMNILLLFWILHGVSLQVSALQMFVGDSVLLPCSFPSFDMENPTGVWRRYDLSPSVVHQRHLEKDQEKDNLTDQNQRYRGRTSMQTDALDSGDLSLTLTQLQLSDTGTYTCSIRDFREERKVTEIVLEVKEWFPSWAVALLALLALLVLVGVVAAVLLYLYRHYFRSVYTVGAESGMESVLLPCKILPCRIRDAARVEWKDRNNRTVHVYQNSPDQPGEQHQFYRTRTRMNTDMLRTGDLSLTLTWPTDNDTDMYTCSVSNGDGDILMEKQVWLWVKVQEVTSDTESVLLPWKTKVQLPDDARVEWRDEADDVVHVYHNGPDQPGEQDQLYRTRTRMDEDPLRTGDLSLTLTWPTERDTKLYTCSVSSREGDILMKKQVWLWVKVQQLEVEEGEESIQLPFRTTPELLEDASVVWKNNKGRRIHLFKNCSKKPKEQNQDYESRTQMNEDALTTGDLSLTLRRPRKEDSGGYKCIVWKEEEHLRRKTVKLEVKARTVQVQVQPEDSSSIDPTPLMADQSV